MYPLHRSVQTGSGAHLAYCQMGYWSAIHGAKSAGRESIHIRLLSNRMRKAIYVHPLPHMYS
jgi:hypothetical protein